MLKDRKIGLTGLCETSNVRVRREVGVCERNERSVVVCVI